MLPPAPQPRQLFHPLPAIPDLDPLSVESGLDPLADQPAGHRIRVPLDVDRAAAVYAHGPPLARLQTPGRQRPQQRPFLRQPPLPIGVELPEQSPQERLVGRSALEVPAAPQHQGLVQRPLELAVALLDVAVLMGLRRLDRLARQAVVPQQGPVTLGEGGPFRPRRHGGGQAVRAVAAGHTAQFPEGVLQPFAEALVALGEADSARLPVRVGQHEMVDQVVEREAGERHAQVGAVREIARRQAARVMHLGEKHLLGRSLQGPPSFDVPLQGTELAIGEAPRITPLQVGEEGLGLQAGVEAKQFFEGRPDLGERVGPGTPVAVHAFNLTGQPAKAAIRARGLGIHAGLGGGQLLGQPFAVEAEELANLLIGDHREPPGVGLPLVYSGSRTGNSSCR
jgi:hypothetical protein